MCWDMSWLNVILDLEIKGRALADAYKTIAVKLWNLIIKLTKNWQ